MLLLVINNDKYYDFAKTNYGDVEVHTDKYGNEEIKYEIFLWDVKNFFEIKLWIHVIKFIEKTNIDKFGIENKKYIFPYYNIGMDSKDQMIPSPTDVIISAHFDLSTRIALSANSDNTLNHSIFVDAAFFAAPIVRIGFLLCKIISFFVFWRIV